MQDRINELAKQCGAVSDFLALGRHDGILFSTLELERFAQAIARECIEQFQRAQYRSGYDVVDGKEVGRFDVGVIDTIRARFGLATPPGDG